MNSANEFLTPVPAAFYPVRSEWRAELIWEGKEAAHNQRLYDVAPHSYTHLDVRHELLGNGELRWVRLRRKQHVAREWLWRTFVFLTASVHNASGRAERRASG